MREQAAETSMADLSQALVGQGAGSLCPEEGLTGAAASSWFQAIHSSQCTNLHMQRK
jgi:hypothetical protein